MRDDARMSDGPDHHERVSATAHARVVCPAVILGLLLAGGATAQPAMKATAPEKMMPPAEKQRLSECREMAAQKNVRMDERAKFLMDCMKAKARQ